MGYDMVRFFERVPDSDKPGLDLPDMFFMLADTMLIFDSLKQKIKIVSNVHVDGKNIQGIQRSSRKIDAITEKLRTTKVRSQKSGAGKSPKQKGFSSSFATKEHSKMQSQNQGIYCSRRYIPGCSFPEVRVQVKYRAV